MPRLEGIGLSSKGDSFMPIKRKGTQHKKASDKRILARVIDEMMRPRFAKSAKLEADGQSHKRTANHTKPHVAKAAKAHTERYGTGTPRPESQP